MAEKEKVLIIEDEAKLARFVELELNYEGYVTDTAKDGREGLEKFENKNYDLILLDLMLPKLNGMEVIRRIRRSSNIPVIMLTAKGETMDKVAGLDSGADDYVTKPFAIEELLARMRVALKRKPSTSEPLILKNITLDPLLRNIKVDKEIVDLTKTEFELLYYMIQNKNIILSREQILNAVWGYDYLGETNIVDVYIRYLRTKLDDRFGTKYIHTVRGVGYAAKDTE